MASAHALERVHMSKAVAFGAAMVLGKQGSGLPEPMLDDMRAAFLLPPER